MKKFKRRTGIILALDAKSKKDAHEIMSHCEDHVDAVKFNYPLILKEGISIMCEIKAVYNKPIIADFKVADVPETNKRIAKLVFDNAADAIMVHGFIGAEALQELIAFAEERKKKIIVVTELTHDGGLDFTNHFANDFALLAKTLGAFGVQAPGTRPDRVKKIREIVGKELCIVSCGIGAQGGVPSSAIAAGADFEIIGRAIYEAKNPKEAIEEIAAKTRKAIEESDAK